MRREKIVRQRFPVGEMQYVDVAAGEDAELGFERVRRVRIARDRDDEPRVRVSRFGERKRKRGSVRRVPVTALLRRRR